MNLNLDNNCFFALKRDFFLNLENLLELTLSDNLILSIENGSFSSLKSLTSLNLEDNLIYDLSGNLFVKLQSLASLILSKNKLDSIDSECFRGLVNLNLLDLSENKIKRLDKNSFKEIFNLKALDLGSNQIQNLNSSLDQLQYLEHLSLSSNLLNALNISSFSFKNLAYLDLSNNVLDLTRNFDFSNFDQLKILNLSSVYLIENLNFPKNSTLQELNLNFNNLALIDKSFFANVPKLKKLFLKETNLLNFDFLVNFFVLDLVDLSNNREYYKELILPSNPVLKFLIANTSYTNELDYAFSQTKYLNASHNHLRKLSDINHYIVDLDLSHNEFVYFLTNEIEVKIFLDKLKSINLAKSLSPSISNKIFYFAKFLEIGIFSEDSLYSFPKFCQPCPFGMSCSWNYEDINFQCQLKILNFDSNRLEQIWLNDLIELENLQVLNLANNRIKSIEANSFSSLKKLEILILSQNVLSLFANNLFNSLNNLNFLNLSSNSIKTISSFTFSQLLKLETLDLSFNLIYSLGTYSFYLLTNLKSLHLNENEPNIQIENDTFFHLESIQTIYISKTILNDETNEILIELVEFKNRLISKVVLEQDWYKSLFLISNYDQYDCDLTLFFIGQNVHYNFKTETQIFDYFNECSQLRIKNVSSESNELFIRNDLIFSDFLFYFFYLTLVFILAMCLSCVLFVRSKTRYFIKQTQLIISTIDTNEMDISKKDSHKKLNRSHSVSVKNSHTIKIFRPKSS